MITVDTKKTQKTILFTSLFLSARTGSELHILELTKAFKRAGWDVTCYTLLATYPLQQDLEAAGIKLVEFGCEEELASSYEVLFGQHHLISDYVWHCTDISFEKVVVSILGLGEMELPPRFVDESDLVLCVSQEAKRRHFPDGHEKAQVAVFPNYATEGFFAAWDPEGYSGCATPKRIAIVSNHIPSELRSLSEYADDDVVVDCLGFEGTSVDITPELLTEYDLAITLGRTVQYCLAAGVPCYCYDRFGGPGYMDEGSIHHHAEYNFSGRSDPRTLDASQLWDDVVAGYQDAVRVRGRLHDLAAMNWDFKVLFASFLASVDELVPHLHRRERWSESERFIQETACRLYRNELLEETGLAQLYWTDEGGTALSEDRSTMIRYRCNTDILIRISDLASRFKIASDQKETVLLGRFDPDTGPCSLKVAGEDVDLVPENADRVENERYLFYSNDPRCTLCPPAGTGTFRFSVEKVSLSEVLEYCEGKAIEDAVASGGSQRHHGLGLRNLFRR